MSQPILYPQSTEVNSAWIGKGTVQWTQLKWEQNPLQWHIIKALAELPIIELAPAMMVKGVATFEIQCKRVFLSSPRPELCILEPRPPGQTLALAQLTTAPPALSGGCWHHRRKVYAS